MGVNMNIREAILAAADQIEARPDQFRFALPGIPVSTNPDPDDNFYCGSVGCALGWIGHFLGMRPTRAYVGYAEVAEIPELGLTETIWYKAEILGSELSSEKAGDFYNRLDQFDPRWDQNADSCAKALRCYAD